MSSRTRLCLIALTTTILACSGETPPAKTEGASAESAVEPAIDTTVPTILGVAMNRTPGAPGWCMLASHRDVWVGRPIKVVWPAYRKIMNTKMGDTISGCPGAEPTPGAKAYELTFEQEPPLEGFPAIVLRNDVWGNVGRDLSATFHLDGDQQFDTITVCTNGSVARFKMVWAGEVPRRPWTHEVPYGTLEEPRCADAAAPVADANAPIFLPSWAVLAPTHELPYGEMWMALRTVDDRSDLVKTPVLPMSAEGTCRSGGGGKKLVAAASPQGHTALFLRIPGLTEGPVEKAVQRPFGDAMTSGGTTLAMKSQEVTIRRETVGTTGFRVTAEAGGSVYTLFETPTSELGRSSVIWAGDLDRDGEIDFILLAHQRNWQSGQQLHLSRQRTALQWPATAAFVERAC